MRNATLSLMEANNKYYTKLNQVGNNTVVMKVIKVIKVEIKVVM